MGATRISRREFLGGAAALGLMPALEASAAGLTRGAPRLKFGRRGEAIIANLQGKEQT